MGSPAPVAGGAQGMVRLREPCCSGGRTQHGTHARCGGFTHKRCRAGSYACGVRACPHLARKDLHRLWEGGGEHDGLAVGPDVGQDAHDLKGGWEEAGCAARDACCCNCRCSSRGQGNTEGRLSSACCAISIPSLAVKLGVEERLEG